MIDEGGTDEISNLSKYIWNSGLAVVLLGLIIVAIIKIAKWFGPKADVFINGLLSNNERVPEMIEDQKRQNGAVLEALNLNNRLLQQIISQNNLLLSQHLKKDNA